jgi:hypothetical protein
LNPAVYVTSVANPTEAPVIINISSSDLVSNNTESTATIQDKTNQSSNDTVTPVDGVAGNIPSNTKRDLKKILRGNNSYTISYLLKNLYLLSENHYY